MTSTTQHFGLGFVAPREAGDAREFLAARDLAASAERVLSISHALATAGRPVDLVGLNLGIGRLTASILDLDIPDGRRLRPSLIMLLHSLDQLEAAITADARARGLA